MRTRSAICLTAIIIASGAAVQAYDFWGVTVGTQTYCHSKQLTFDGLAKSNIQYTVGGYEYTRVDSQWLGPFPAASPGADYLVSQKCDAQGLFFKADPKAAHFMIITGSLQTGITAPECGCGKRRYGPGDLKIDVNGVTYGVGLRLSNLLWAVDPETTNPEFRLINPAGGFEDIHARDTGTLGRVELNPRWARTGNSTLAAGSDNAYAFYISGSGVLTGEATVGFSRTRLALGAAPVYAYEVDLPWSSMGLTTAPHSLTASYRPDCGNDILSAQFQPGLDLAIPEPSSWISLAIGLAAVTVRKTKR